MIILYKFYEYIASVNFTTDEILNTYCKPVHNNCIELYNMMIVDI